MFIFGIEDIEAPLEELVVLVVQSLLDSLEPEIEPEIELEVDIFTYVAGELALVNLPPEALDLLEVSQTEAALSLLTVQGGFIVGIVVTGEGGLATYTGLIVEIIASFELDTEIYWEKYR